VKVLVVDDDSAVRESVGMSLSFEGYTVTTARDGVEAVAAVEADAPDVVVLDVQMPRLDGIGACRRLRAHGFDLPILMLTARESTNDRVIGLDAGADDYLVKPFALEELLARLRALSRRSRWEDGPGARLTFADITLDATTREVRRGGVDLALTRIEFNLLELLLSHPRQVLSRVQILDAVWGYSAGTGSNSLEVHIGLLRRKTEQGGMPRVIQTVWGVGYVLREL